MNRYQKENAIRLISGYYLPRPEQSAGLGGGLKAAFELAKEECAAHLRAQIANVEALTFEDFKAPLPRKCPPETLSLLHDVSKGDTVTVSVFVDVTPSGVGLRKMTVTAADEDSFCADGLWFYRSSGDAYIGKAVVVSVEKAHE